MQLIKSGKYSLRGGLIVLVGFLVFQPVLTWSDPGWESRSPFNSSSNRLVQIQAARADFLRRMALDRHRNFILQGATPINIGLDVEPITGLPHLTLHGPVGQCLQVDFASSLMAANWESLLTANMTANSLDWLDSTESASTARFYRLTPLNHYPTPYWADDVLMIDQAGVAHELFYPTDLKALVVAAIGESGTSLRQALAAFQALAQTAGTNGVQYWLLLNDPTAERTNVAAQVHATGLNFPVLIDPQGFGIRALRMAHAGEVVVLQPPAFAIAYHGQLDLDANSISNQPYVAAAITSLVQSQPMTFLYTPATGAALATMAGQTPLYDQDVAPILYQRCAICHHANDSAPFAFTNYSVVVTWAAAIKHDLLIGQMPPWHADAEYGQWANSLAMPATEKDTILRWIDAGLPRGGGSDPLADLPPRPSYRSWPSELGPPDALVDVGVQPVKATGTEEYRYLFTQTPNSTNVWLRAAIILPSNPQVVHHYLVWTNRAGNQGLPNISTYQDSFAGYAPGIAPYIYPADSGYFLTASNWVTFNLHYTPNGVATNDFPQLALWYHKIQPPKTFHNLAIANPLFAIAPHNPESPIRASWTFANSVTLHRLNPHMHLRGKYARFDAVYPDGSQEELLSVPAYDFRWQTSYVFAQPKVIPAQTTIVVTGAFDNSVQNLNNPDPNATVYWGDQTTSEMFVGFVDYVE